MARPDEHDQILQIAGNAGKGLGCALGKPKLKRGDKGGVPMIVSYRHGFIFCHSRKTAGSSIKVAFAPHLGPLDILVGGWSDAISAGHRPNLRLYWDLASLGGFKALAKSKLSGSGMAINVANKRRYSRVLGPSPEHTSASKLRRFVGEDVWTKHFKFCFVRNPFAKAVSDWRWRVRVTGHQVPFERFIRDIATGEKSPVTPAQPDNWPIYTIDNEPAMDYIGRFENLDHDIRHIFDIIGLPHPPAFPHAKASPKQSHYKEHYTPPIRKEVEVLFARELEAFGYQF